MIARKLSLLHRVDLFGIFFVQIHVGVFFDLLVLVGSSHAPVKFISHVFENPRNGGYEPIAYFSELRPHDLEGEARAGVIQESRESAVVTAFFCFIHDFLGQLVDKRVEIASVFWSYVRHGSIIAYSKIASYIGSSDVASIPFLCYTKRMEKPTLGQQKFERNEAEEIAAAREREKIAKTKLAEGRKKQSREPKEVDLTEGLKELANPAEKEE